MLVRSNQVIATSSALVSPISAAKKSIENYSFTSQSVLSSFLYLQST